MVFVLSLAVCAVVALAVATPFIVARAVGSVVKTISEAQAAAWTSSAEAMSVAARSITAPYSVRQAEVDGEQLPPAPSAPAWTQDDQLLVDDLSDPTDHLMPDPPFFRPDAVVMGQDSRTGVDGLVLGQR